MSRLVLPALLIPWHWLFRLEERLFVVFAAVVGFEFRDALVFLRIGY
jgi:hypothetical protein